MSDLAKKNCIPCRGGVPPLSTDEIEPLLKQLGDWNIIETHHLLKVFPFPDFRTALDFVNKVGQLAEEQDHHPDLFLTWGKVEVKIWTHKIDGLTESDFILASKTDQIYDS
jgi:4a-hydroxytetrahydrobiopterin dehydratase